jgi:hypothetical protein
MRILAFLTDSFTTAGILRHLGLHASPPPLTPARAPPPDEPTYDADPLLDLDQTPVFDPTDPARHDGDWGVNSWRRVSSSRRSPACWACWSHT